MSNCVRSGLCLVLGLSLLVACGGGGGGGGGTPPASGTAAGGGAGSGGNPPVSPDPGADLVRGVITGFGSVFIDGVRYSTDTATFIVDGKTASQDDLSEGMLVNMAGDRDQGVASVVRFDEDVEGPVDSVGVDELTVFGQTVLLAADTVFSGGLTLASIQVGDVLEISGLRDANDNIVASFIDREDGVVDKYEVLGNVRDLDATSETFRIGGLTVDYSTALLDDLDSGLANGRLVEVKDQQLVYTPGAFSVIASEVEGKNLTDVREDDDDVGGEGGGGLDDNASEGSRVEIESFITEMLGSDGFRLAGLEVRFDNATVFEYGVAADLAVGVRVEVYGVIDADGVLQATKIEFEDNEARVAGQIELIDLDAQTLVVFGVTVQVPASTEIENELNDDDSATLADLMVGDYVEVEGRADGNVIVASEIEVDELDRTELRGIAGNVDAAAGTLEILGITVTTDGRTDYEGFNDEPLTMSEFFERVVDGQTSVEAQWDDAVTDATVPARELELED